MRKDEGCGKHRRCVLCGQRADNCFARGCRQFEHTPDVLEYSHFKQFLSELDGRKNARRHSADCIDVSVAATFAKQCLAEGRPKLAVFSCCVLGQYGNNLQTWSKLLEAREHGEIRWCMLSTKILECASLFAKSKASKGLHSRNCLPGRGFDKDPDDTDHAGREVRGSLSMWSSSHFEKAVSQMAVGVHTFSDYMYVLNEFEHLQKEVPGCLGEYHLKLAMDHMVLSGLLPKASVTVWPVAPTGGTAKGLRRIYKTDEKRPAVLRKMLLELFTRLRRDRAITANDWPGSVGAALCWQKRTATVTRAGVSRYDFTTDTSELELAVLKRLGIPVPGRQRSR